MLKWLVVCPILLSAACLATPLDQWDREPARSSADAFLLRSTRWLARVPGDPAHERIRLLVPAPGTAAMSPEIASLRINWLNPGPVEHYRRSLDRQSGIATTCFVRNGARITQTIFLSAEESLLVLHLHADKPGALDFEAAFGRPDHRKSAIRSRRELDAGKLRAWVLPFESDVEPSEGGIVVRGEGEALILVAEGSRTELDRRLGRLGLRFDGREAFPDLTRIWSGLLALQDAPAP